MKKLTSLLLLSLICLLLSSCGTSTSTGGKKVKYPNEVTSSWKNDFNQAEKEFDAKNYKEAEKLYKSYIQKYLYNELTDKSSFRLGQIAMIRQDYPQAIQVYRALVKKTPSASIKSKSNAKLGICYYRQKNYGEALSSFGAVDESQIDDHERVKVASFAIKASNELKEDQSRKAYYYALLLDVYEPLTDGEIDSKFGKEIVSKSEVKPKLKEWVNLSTPYEIIDRRLLDYKAKASEPYVDFKIGKSAYESKNNQKAGEYLRRYVSKNPNGEYLAQANKMLASVGSAGSSAVSIPKKEGGKAIGVILPLSGKYEQYGNNALKGMECAASDKPECHGLSNINLIVKDSGGDPAKSASLVDELVSKDKVLAILGPLPSVEVDDAAKQAQKKGVVLLALAQKKVVAELGDNIFRFSLTPSVQVETLLKYATSRKKAKNFAVLYPKSNYGQEFLAEFVKQVPNFKGKIVAKQEFASGKEDLGEEIRKLKLGTSEAKSGGKIFDAIFIPDSYLTIGKIAPALSKSGLGDTLILGTNAWNDASLPERIGNNLSNAVFVDIYFRDSAQPFVKNFVKEFQEAFSYTPSTLEAMGYDSVRVVGEALKSKVSQKDEMKPALLKIRGFQGVTGLKGFQSDREAQIQPYLLSVDGNGIKEIK